MFAILGLPAIGWGVSVERRLAKLDAIKETGEKTEKKVDKILDHLIEAK